MLKKLVLLADHLDKKGLHKEATFIDKIIATAGKPTEWNRESSKTGTPPPPTGYECHDCGKPAEKFFSYGRNNKYSAVCNGCHEAYLRDNPPR